MIKKNWILKAFLMTFFIALFFSGISNIIANAFNIYILILITFVIIFIGILFDMIGTAVLTANESSFHAKSSKKIKGAKESLTLIKNSVRVSSVCNDVIGDICGIISGSTSASIALIISSKFNFNLLIVSCFATIFNNFI